jgi:transcriptional antiterminator NusG
MVNLGVCADNFEVEFKEGDVIRVVSGVWKDTVAPIRGVNQSKQSVTINVELFGRETPVEISFAEIRKM